MEKVFTLKSLLCLINNLNRSKLGNFILPKYSIIGVRKILTLPNFFESWESNCPLPPARTAMSSILFPMTQQFGLRNKKLTFLCFFLKIGQLSYDISKIIELL